MEVLHPAAAAILTLLLYALVRQLRPEFAPLVLLAGISLILLSSALPLTGLYAEIRAMLQEIGIDDSSVSILLRALGVCIVSQLAADLCRDHAASALGTAVELVGRISALILALPFLRAVLTIASEMMHV